MSALFQREKTGVVGFFKKLLGKSNDNNNNPGGNRVVGATPGRPWKQPSSAPVAKIVPPAPKAGVAQSQESTAATPGVSSNGVTLPLQSVLNALPVELRTKVRMSDAGAFTITIPFEKILSQLSTGMVKVPFADIRAAAPQVFSSGIESDRILVTLPLNEILSRINPALLVRRTAQRQVEVPDEITSPFDDAQGQGLSSLSVGNAKPVTPAAPRKAAPAPEVPGRGSISSAQPAPVEDSEPDPFPIPGKSTAKATPAPAPAAPAAPAPTPIPMKPSFAPAAAVPPPKAAPIPMAKPAPAVAPVAKPVPAAAPVAKPTPAAAPIPMATAAAKPVVPSTGDDGLFINVLLSALAESWPEGVRQEIAQLNLGSAKVALPVEPVELALKKGRILFAWKVVRAWIRPAIQPTTSAHDAVDLELPLKVIAPLFVARGQGGRGVAKKTTVDEAIPDLFFGFPRPEAAPTAAPVTVSALVPSPVAPSPAAPIAPPPPAALSLAPEPETSPIQAFAPTSEPESEPDPFPIPGKSTARSGAAAPTPVPAPASIPQPMGANTNYFAKQKTDTNYISAEQLYGKGPTGTEFLSRYASPNEIVNRASVLEGVAGVLIALPDGLMVASKIPADQNGDTLAAFLPQLFAKMSSCTKELRMGELNNLNFTVGNIPWKIFRVNAIFFAVFGREGEPLPTAQLAALARELDRKNK